MLESQRGAFVHRFQKLYFLYLQRSYVMISPHSSEETAVTLYGVTAIASDE